ncbi:MAG: polysaccharide biosynthesis C-terminal domain-containing protein, partial [Hyphomicrobiales bacterium]|nr:polysaccharide biosynthesis C-terminal domain-containing protein [Hyphomicrobiales bacterium]
VLLNLFVMAFLALAFLFPNAGIAASWGVVVSGIAQLALLMAEARRRGVLERLAVPTFDIDVRRFFGALGPAVVGSAGQQIAILADTILASALPTGAVSSIYYADRLFQLPLGVIGVAAGTVLLPEMSRRLAAGDPQGAASAQNRAIALSLALAAPFLVAFLVLPDEVVRGAFLRERFDAVAAVRSAAVLAAYGLGLVPMVLIRSAVAGFQSRGDTTTPMLCFFGGLVINLALKVGLYQSHGAVGLALATAAGAWVNFALLILISLRRGLMQPDAKLIENVAITIFCAGVAGFVAPLLFGGIDQFVRPLPVLRNELDITLTGVAVLFVYASAYSLAAQIFGRTLRRQLL